MRRNRASITRRHLLAATPAILACRSFAAEPNGPVEAYEAETGGRIGLYAENIVSGATLAWRADKRFIMCSTFKASLAALVLNRVDRGDDGLDRIVRYGAAELEDYAPIAKTHLTAGAMPVGQLCEGAVEYSDNTCANLLLSRVGGPGALTAYWRGLGDRVSRLDHNEPLLNRSPPGDPRDTTTPKAMAGSLRTMLFGRALSPASREQLITWLVGCKTGADRLRGGLPRAWRIGDKTGSNGRDAAGDLAVAWPQPDRPVLICAYTQGGAPRPDQIKAVFAEIGQMAGARLA